MQVVAVVVDLIPMVAVLDLVVVEAPATEQAHTVLREVQLLITLVEVVVVVQAGTVLVEAVALV
jgi:hypothetical protein